MFFFFKWVRISPEIDWYHYQGASPAPTCIVWHQTMTKTATRWSVTSEPSVLPPPKKNFVFAWGCPYLWGHHHFLCYVLGIVFKVIFILGLLHYWDSLSLLSCPVLWAQAQYSVLFWPSSYSISRPLYLGKTICLFWKNLYQVLLGEYLYQRWIVKYKGSITYGG